MAEVAHQAHACLRRAGLPSAVVREARDGGVEAGARVYLVPSVRELCAPTWHQLHELATQGATVWASYCAGENGWQRGPWRFRMRELFGVDNDLHYGLNEPVEGERVRFTFDHPLGDIEAGEVLEFRVAGSDHAGARLPVVVHEGTVIARDQWGNPAIVANPLGAGWGVLCTYPVEYFGRRGRGIDPTWRLYRALARLAGVEVPVVVDEPEVLVDGLRHADGREFWFLVSQSPQHLRVHPRGPGVTSDEAVELPPFGYAVITTHTAD